MNREDDGISEIVSEIMIVLMVLMLAVIIAILVFGVFKPVDKTAYLVPQFNLSTLSGKTVITIFDRGGEPVYFNGSPQAKYKAVLYVDTPSGSYSAVPAPSLTVFKPGDMVYAYYTGSGFILTNSLSGLTFPSLPGGKLTVRFVDATSGVLIAKEDLVNGPVTTGPTTTATTTATPTATATTTTTTTTTTTVTSTATTPLPVLVANFNAEREGGSRTFRFTDASTGSPTTWSWDFGDTGTGSGQPVNHHYSTSGSYSVKLTITRGAATATITKTINV